MVFKISRRVSIMNKQKFALKKMYMAVLPVLSIPVLMAPAFSYAAPAADSAYVTDPQYSHVEDETSKGIGQVNMITCIMSSMRPEALVNQGNYIALVDQAVCDPSSRSSSSNAGSTNAGSQSANYMTATVNSSRASNSDPMIGKIWIDDTNEGGKALIFVRTAATAAPTPTNPYGIFRLDFCGRGIDDNSGQLSPQCGMQGYLEGGTTGLSYYQQEDKGNGLSTTALQLNATGTTTGSGKMSLDENDSGNISNATFAFAYNHDYFLRGNQQGSQCFSRDAADPQTKFSVWRYGMYDANTGARVTRNSGFPIEYTATTGETYNGYLGYWGLSLPPEAANDLSSGKTIQKVDYSGGQSPTKTAYTVVKVAGKLTKYTKQTRQLNQIDKIKFNVFVGNVTGFYSGATPFSQYEVYWDDANGNFKVTGVMNCGNNGCQTQTLPNEQAVSASFWASQGGVQGYSQSLGGEVFIDLHGVSGSINSSAITVVYRTQDLVYPDAMAALGNLHCLSNCPTSATMASYFAQNSSDPSPFALFNNWNGVASGSIVNYSSANALLRDGSAQAVTFTDSNALGSHPQYQSGVRSGRLFTDADLASVQCDDQSGNYCDYKVNTLQTYYVWETGANSWNQFAAVKDANNNFVNFDAPLQVNYTVPNDAVRYGEYAGKSIVLQYGGYGELSGIPGYCVSPVDNSAVSCNTQNARYVPAFIIPAGASVTTSSSSYLVKWLEREIRFARKDTNTDPTACAGLTLPTNSITLPTAAVLQDPSDSSLTSTYIGTKPVLTSAPRVIQGDVKY
jgi:hypothetical protein